MEEDKNQATNAPNEVMTQASHAVESPAGAPEPSGSNKKNLKLLVIAVLVALVTVSALILILFFNQKKPQATPTLEQVTNEAKAEKATTAEKVGTYLYKQKRTDGYNNLLSHFDELCGGANSVNCPFGERNVFEINNSWSALGFFGKYKVGGDQKDLVQAKSDLSKLKDYCSQAGKMKECLWVLAQPALIAMDEPNTEYNDFLKTAGDLLVTTSNKTNVMLLAIESRELALIYTLLKDEKYLVASKERFELARDAYVKGLNADIPSRENNPLQACWVTLAAAELARVSKGQDYIVEAAKVHTDEYIRTKKYENPFAVNIQPCIETHYIISSLTGDQGYYNEGLRLLRFMEENFVDSKEKNIAWGEGGVLAVNPKSNTGGQINKQVNVTDSSYMLYLLYLYNPK